MIELRGVDKTFITPAEEVHVLKDVDLLVAGGELVCVLGESGSGKTTLLNIIAGLEDVSAGQVTVAGTDVVAATPAARSRLRLHDVGMVFQDHNLIHEFTALENVVLPLAAAGQSMAGARVEAQEALDRVGVGELSGRYPGEMSGGQRQRVGIARSLVGGKRALLCDEPTGALDQDNSRILYELLSGLVVKDQLAVVLCTHDLHALDYASRSYRVAHHGLEDFQVAAS